MAKKRTKKKEVQQTIHLVHILDCSGSMFPDKYKAANSMINEELQQFPTLFKHVRFTLCEFGSRNNIYVKTDIPFTNVPLRRSSLGMTALFNAIRTTLSTLKEKYSGDKFLIKIFTDGHENDSVFGREEINLIIEGYREAGHTVTFVGTKEDVEWTVANLAIKQSNTLIHDNTVTGIKLSGIKSMAANVVYKAKVSTGQSVTDGFYTDKEIIDDKQSSSN